MSTKKGDLYYMHHKQKLNTMRSTEVELVATDDVMPQLLWKIYLL